MGSTAKRRILGLIVAAALLSARADAGAPDDEAARRLAAGIKAAAAGNADAARHEFLAALELGPGKPDLWGEAAKLDEKDAELLALWLADAAAACADLTPAKFKPSKSWPKLGEADVLAAAKLASLRAAAVKAVNAAAAKADGAASAATLRFLDGLSHVLADGAPGLLDGRDDAFAKGRAKVVPNKKAVLGALDGLMTSAFTKGDLATALGAARIVRALSVQDGQTKTAPSIPGDGARRALDMIEKVRAEMRRREDAAAAPPAPPAPDAPPSPDAPAPAPGEKLVWTAAELEAIPKEELPAWNEAHRTWAKPGVGISKAKLYRIETTCGLETLRTAAEIVDAQHERLVAWFGSDPTKRRPGLVRICPDDADFEGEGAPFWWAAGFQGGDLTTMICRFPTPTGMAGTIVHELTHRFDFAAYGGLPAWLAEGRATYTEAGCFGPFTGIIDERATNWEMLWEAGAKDYGSQEGLQKLLRGTIDDYRHNYPAGYSLWLFLVRYGGFDKDQAGARPYAPKVAAYVDSFRTNRNAEPVARFTQAFCDGQDGRAKDLAGFCEAFRRFLWEGGSGAEPPAPWVQTWRKRADDAWKDARSSPADFVRIYDAPTWSTDRTRTDAPVPGENQAYFAAELLLANGLKAPALEAYRWSLVVDDPSADRWSRAADAESAGGDAAAAWAARAVAHHLSPRRVAPPTTPPTGAALPAWNAARDLADAYGAAAAAAKAANRPRLARAMRAEQARIAEQIALALPADPDDIEVVPPPREEGVAGPPPSSVVTRVPELLPFRSVLAQGVVEERWSPGETEPGEWFQPEPDSLELGRSKTAAATSGTVRDAGVRRMFVRGREVYSGTYSFKTRLRFMSAFAAAELVVGHSTKDRGVVVRLTGGDWSFAAGKSDESTPLTVIGVSLSDGRRFSAITEFLATDVQFEQPKQIFDVEVRVCGPYVRVFVNGTEHLSHRVRGDAPVEGHIGFGLQSGIVRFEQPLVRRHRVTGPERRSPEESFDAPLDLKRPTLFSWASAAGRRFDGLPPSKHATVVLWYPETSTTDDYSEGPAVRAVQALRQFSDQTPCTIIAAVPFSVTKDAAAELVANATTMGFDSPGVLTHEGSPPLVDALRGFTKQEGEGLRWAQILPPPIWIAVDRDGIIRGAGPFGSLDQVGNLLHAAAGR